MNNKGFTLVELIVVIALVAIITLIALPSIMKTQENNATKKYEQYGQSLKNAAKYYVEKNRKDLFVTKDCVVINASVLENEDLVKPLTIKGASCTNAKIKVTNKSNGFIYELNIKCSKGSKIVYQNTVSVTTCEAVTS